MTDIEWHLTTTDMLMTRIGQSAFPDKPTRRVALALGMLAQPADAMGITATICIDPVTVNMAVNAHVTDGACTVVTMGQTIHALDRLVEMEFIHETAQVIDPRRVHLLDCGALVSRIDPVRDFCGPEPDYGIGHEGPTIRPDEREAA